MIITTLALSFLLSLLPLVIGTLCYRYRPNLFSRGILTLSALGSLLGLGQFSLLLGTSYKLFEPAQMKQAYLGLQYVSIAGGTVMILAGLLWVGYFRTLMKMPAPVKKASRTTAPAAKTAPLAEEALPVEAPAKKARTPRPRREKPAPAEDWFADELPATRTVKMAAKISRQKVSPPPRKGSQP